MGSMTSHSTSSNQPAILNIPKCKEIFPVNITNAFLFGVPLGKSMENSITDWANDNDYDDVSELSEPESCMLESMFKLLLGSEMNGVQPSIN
jgi:hypothetical protein